MKIGAFCSRSGLEAALRGMRAVGADEGSLTRVFISAELLEYLNRTEEKKKEICQAISRVFPSSDYNIEGELVLNSTKDGDTWWQRKRGRGFVDAQINEREEFTGKDGCYLFIGGDLNSMIHIMEKCTGQFLWEFRPTRGQAVVIYKDIEQAEGWSITYNTIDSSPLLPASIDTVATRTTYTAAMAT